MSKKEDDERAEIAYHSQVILHKYGVDISHNQFKQIGYAFDFEGLKDYILAEGATASLLDYLRQRAKKI